MNTFSMLATMSRYGIAVPSALSSKMALPRAVDSFTTPAGITSSLADSGVPKFPPFAFADSLGACRS